MSLPRLSEYFVGAAARRLSEVEIDKSRSNQHELAATRPVRSFLGDSPASERLEVRFVYVDDESAPLIFDTQVTYYDTRKDQDRAPEYRMYYADNDVTDAASAGDTMVIAKRPDGDVLIVFARQGSTVESQLMWLFDISFTEGNTFAAAGQQAIDQPVTPRSVQVLLDAFGIEPEVSEPDYLEILLTEFGGRFPTTAASSALARRLVVDIDPLSDPDGALLRWWDTEYLLFQTLERHIVSVRLEEGFTGDTAVEDFLSFSLTVQNRRKSRSGHAFENHIEHLLGLHNVRVEKNTRTERGSKPDFLFPGQVEYNDPEYPVEQLHRLGAKTNTVKLGLHWCSLGVCLVLDGESLNRIVVCRIWCRWAC